MKKSVRKTPSTPRKSKWVFFGMLNAKKMKEFTVIRPMRHSRFVSVDEVFLPKTIRCLANVENAVYFASDENPHVIACQTIGTSKNDAYNAKRNYELNLYPALPSLSLDSKAYAMCASERCLYALVYTQERENGWRIIRWRNKGFSEVSKEIDADISLVSMGNSGETLRLLVSDSGSGATIVIHDIAGASLYVGHLETNAGYVSMERLDFEQGQIVLPYKVNENSVSLWVALPNSGELTHYEVALRQLQVKETASHSIAAPREITALAYYDFNLVPFGMEETNPILFIAARQPNAIYGFACKSTGDQVFSLVENASSAFFQSELVPIDTLFVLDKRMLLAGSQKEGLLYALEFPMITVSQPGAPPSNVPHIPDS